MKTTRVNLPNNVKEQHTIDTYLTAIYNKKGRFTNLQKIYEESRKTEKSREYRTNNVVKEAVISSYPDSTWGFFYI